MGVTCQLRFPPILRIEAEAPVAFQEQVRQDYPGFQVKAEPGILGGLPADIVGKLGIDQHVRSGAKAYEFLSADEKWTVSLTRDFLALTTREYRRWEEFRAHLENPVAALRTVYNPSYYLRIGLRYQDVVRRSSLGLSGDTAWSELLAPHLLGELGSQISLSIVHAYRNVLIRLQDDHGLVNLQHGLASVDNEVCYTIDADFFSDERQEIDHGLAALDRFNTKAGRLFRWCITDELHRAMEPRPLE